MLSSHPCPSSASTHPSPASFTRARALTLPPSRLSLPRSRLLSRACHATQPSNRDSAASLVPPQSSPAQHRLPLTTLKIAVIGFGNFGQFLAKTFSQQGHTVLAHSRTDFSSLASSLPNTTFFPDIHDLCESHPDVVLLCTSILSADKVLRSIPIQRLHGSTLFADVLSVKEYSRSIFLDLLPLDFDILCTHPMFGPESGKHGLDGLPLSMRRSELGTPMSAR